LEVRRKDAPKVEDGSLIDLLVVYTPAAEGPGSAQGGIVRLIELGVAEANTALANSRVETRLRLVHVAKVALEETSDTTIQTLLFQLFAPNDGVLDEVYALREQYKADLVQLIGETTNGGCGTGFLMRGSDNELFERQAFSYAAARCISPGYTLAHELGHNLGCNHSKEDPTGQGAFPYSYGYKDPEHGFRTVMAYPCETDHCPRVLHFSNPAVSRGRHPTGTSSQHNSRSINNIRVLVSNFRVGSGDGGGNGGGTICRRNRSSFVGCKGGGCKVCAEKIAGYSGYLSNHPGCIVNPKCRGKGYAPCSVTCPTPTQADR
jgi:hypothetical protein